MRVGRDRRRVRFRGVKSHILMRIWMLTNNLAVLDFLILLLKQ